MNFWLKNAWAQEIKQLDPKANSVRVTLGKWYVVGYYQNEYKHYKDEFVGTPAADRLPFWYLHSDGIWYRVTLNDKAQWTGYYDTREKAEEVASQMAKLPPRMLHRWKDWYN